MNTKKIREKLQDKPEVKPQKTFIGLKSTDIFEQLCRYKVQISQVLPQYITPERIIQICTTVISRNPKIKECSTESIIGAVLQSAILNLDPTPQLSECCFVPYLNTRKGIREVNFQLMYKGVVKLIYNTGLIKNINVKCVYKNDIFDYQEGDEARIVHKPALENRGELFLVYAIIELTTGGKQRIVLNRADVMRLRDKSPASKSKDSPWNVKEDEFKMWLKSALKQCASYLPIETKISKNIVADEVVMTPENFKEKGEGIEIADFEYEANNMEKPKQIESPKEEANIDDAISKMTIADFVTVCTARKEEIKQIFSDDKEYYKVLAKFNCKHSNQVPYSQYKDVLLTLESIVTQAREEMNNGK